MKSIADNAEYIEKTIAQGAGETAWIHGSDTTLPYLPKEINKQTGTSPTLLKTDTPIATGDKILMTKLNDNVDITEFVITTVTNIPNSTYINFKESAVSGSIVIPDDGVIDIGIAGGGASGFCGGGTGVAKGGGGAGMVNRTNIAVTKGQVIPFTIGVGGAKGKSQHRAGTNSTILNVTGRGATNASGIDGGGDGVLAGAGYGTAPSGANGSGWNLPALSIANAGVGGTASGNSGGGNAVANGGKYGGGGGGGATGNRGWYVGGDGTFGGGGGGGVSNSAYGTTAGDAGAGGDGYIYIAYKQTNHYSTPITHGQVPVKVFFNDAPKVSARLDINDTNIAFKAWTELSEGARTYDGFKFTQKYGNFSGSGHTLQRKIVAGKTGTVLYNPFTTQMHK